MRTGLAAPVMIALAAAITHESENRKDGLGRRA